MHVAISFQNYFCGILQDIGGCVSIFIYSEIIFLISSLTHWLFRSVFSFHIFVDFQSFLLLSISSFFPLWSENIVCMICLLKFPKTCFMSCHYDLRECFMCTCEEWAFYYCLMKYLYMSVKSIWSEMCFNFNAFLLIFCMDGVFIVKSEVLKPNTITVLLCISTFQSVSICLIILRCSDVGRVYNCYTLCTEPLIMTKRPSLSHFHFWL